VQTHCHHLWEYALRKETISRLNDFVLVDLELLFEHLAMELLAKL
jgi:hypothetical protein